MTDGAIPEEALDFWYAWELRTLVLSSLLLQITLVIFGSKRKYYSGVWVSFVVWFAYVWAEWVATTALGVLLCSDPDNSDKLQAFWAPFFLLHLGGPDTITSYSLADSEFWSRHLLALISQALASFFVYLKYWRNDDLDLLTIPVFVAGIIKYGERIFVLKNSSTAWNYENDSSIFLQSVGNLPTHTTNHFRRAHYLYKFAVSLFQGSLLEFDKFLDTYGVMSDASSSDAFKLVETELSLIYDIIYTKVGLVLTPIGLFLRFITFLSSVVALLVFSTAIHGLEKNTYTILTYLLLSETVFMEVYALVRLIFSNWTMIWLSKFSDPQDNCVCKAFYHCLWEAKPWSGLIGQHNLIDFCLKSNRHRWMHNLYIDEIFGDIKYASVKYDRVTEELKGAIFTHILKKARIVWNNSQGEDFQYTRNERALKERDSLLSLRGRSVFEGKQNLEKSLESVTDFPFGNGIIIWHIATDICYYHDNHPDATQRKISKILSDYMLYLVGVAPNLLSTGDRSVSAYRNAKEEIESCKLSSNSTNRDQLIDSMYESVNSELLVQERKAHRKPAFNKNAMVYDFGLRVATELKGVDYGERWHVISEVWLEMLAYAASNSDWKEHAEHLRKGGELLTHVRLLMALLGLTQQFQPTQS